VEPSQLDALRSLRPLVVVDVRSPAEFAAGHMTGAVNVPLDALDDRHGELRSDVLLVRQGRWTV
jgi:rhodanese-related sulfurtransferase